MMKFAQLEAITEGKIVRLSEDRILLTLLTDSRKASSSEGAVFFAIQGDHHDGHQYLDELYSVGVRQFVIEKEITTLSAQPDVNVLVVRSSIDALQKIVGEHRSRLSMPVIGITGSNGKTIVKEWLFQLLSSDYKIAKNPGSYNSQIGVPLSVWQLQAHHDLGIFEAGISKPGEMENLAQVIHPTIGIFTNLGSAHDEGFDSPHQKLIEKLKLFASCKLVIYCSEHQLVHETIQKSELPTLSWGSSSTASIHVKGEGNQYTVSFKGSAFSLTLPFKDKASVENCFHCVALMLHQGYNGSEIQQRIQSLQSVPMRLELKEGINQSQIIDDSYNNDLAGLQISLEFHANQHQKIKKRLILSDILESGLSAEELARSISIQISKNKINSFIGIGKSYQTSQNLFPVGSLFFDTTDAFLHEFNFDTIQQEVVLVKGARKFQFEKIIARLQRKVHGTIMEIDLGAVVQNLNYFKSLIKPSTKIMVMVKAFAYGSGSTEIANLLQYHKVDYLGVAYADEGVDLRKNNISLPIMVMNPTEESFGTMLSYKLEPEIFSFKILNSLITFLQGRTATIHLKLDTGMHRLGFTSDEIDALIKMLTEHPYLNVASIFSHLAGADEGEHDSFSITQASTFKKNADKICSALNITPIRHILNSPGILRLPDLQFDMVRLGIGLYGVDPTANPGNQLKPVATLKTIISQIKNIPAGDTIGYGRRGKAKLATTIATIAIGYADGFSRAFSRGVGKVMVNGKVAPVIGNVCMDMTMIDISDIPAMEGDEVIIFGAEYPIQNLAESIQTIPYEILTNTSERVKRVFVAESI
jgi:Alr-MurF fusion protein